MNHTRAIPAKCSATSSRGARERGPSGFHRQGTPTIHSVIIISSHLNSDCDLSLRGIKRNNRGRAE